MKWIKTLTAVVAIWGLSGTAEAGLFNFKLGGHCGAAKSCGCAPTCQPLVCKPTITRPCGVSVHMYQRKCADIKPPCAAACAPKACAPAPKACAPAPAPACVAPAPKACVAPAPQVCAPAPKACVAPAPQVCAPAPKACAGPQPACGPLTCCDADPCEIARLIYESQTCCYARQRAKALRKLGKNSCICNPEIMSAFVYGLNDADERVRAQAASEIASQLRKHGPCCCSPQVVAALTCALADCDKRVRKLSEKGLRLCGYDVIDGACQVACGPQGCVPGPNGGLPPAPIENGGEAAPAPAPPVEDEPKAYFPSRLNQQQTSQPAKKPNRLANLFGLLN